MAAHTRFSVAELRKILSEYDLGELQDNRPFHAGYVQTNIFLKTTTGKFVLRYYENRIKRRVQFETHLLNHLHSHNYPCAKPMFNKKNRCIGLYKRKPYVIFNYIKGRHLKNLNKKQLREMIKHLAILHNLTASYKPTNYQHTEPRTKSYCLETATTESKRFKDKQEGTERLRLMKSRLKKLKLPRALPKGIIHGDFDKANLKFAGNKLLGVLDFDDACQAFLIYDLGVAILYWTRLYRQSFDLNMARDIVNIYSKHRKLSKLEKLHLFDAVQFSALMIMSWMMYDKWKGKDLFKQLAGILNELDTIGREQFYTILFR